MNLQSRCGPFRGRPITRFMVPLAVVAMVLLAFAASASATFVNTTTGGATATPTIHFVSEGGHVTLANSNANIECSFTAEGKVETHGVLEPAGGKFSALSFTGCTNGWTVTVNAKGSFGILTYTGGHNGTFGFSGTTLTAILHTIFGDITCRYLAGFNNFMGSITGGNPATLRFEGKIPFHSGGGLCGEGNSQIAGNLVTTSALYVNIE
jgi:hypothetical protein